MKKYPWISLALALFSVVLVTLALNPSLARTAESGAESRNDSQCPKTELGETEADCPFAGVVRKVDALEILSEESIDELLREEVPALHARIKKEALGIAPALSLWGESLNFDEGVKATIIREEIIDYLLSAFGAGKRKGKIVHAGVEHTYGYLFSNLQTPFGYKRARWVGPDFDLGFAFPSGTLGPNAADGGLFSNITYFAGQIAFRDESSSLGLLEQLSSVSPAVKSYDYSSLNVRRLEETLTFTSGEVILRTDFVEFPKEKGANAEALIYSVVDARGLVPSGPKLITMFPVASDFAARALDPKGLGENQPIQTRYNAYLSGITHSASKFTGTRCVILKGTNRTAPFEKHCH